MYRSAASGETPRGRPLSLSALTQSKHSKGNIKYEPDIVISRDIIGGAGLVGPENSLKSLLVTLVSVRHHERD